MANIEKHQNQPMEKMVDAGLDADPMRARRSHLIGRYVSGQQNEPVILRLEELPATSHNLKRIRERVRLLNEQLAASGMPFRLRVV